MRPDIGDWSGLLAAEREMDYFESLYSFLYENQSREIYPPKENMPEDMANIFMQFSPTLRTHFMLKENMRSRQKT